MKLGKEESENSNSAPSDQQAQNSENKPAEEKPEYNWEGKMFNMWDIKKYADHYESSLDKLMEGRSPTKKSLQDEFAEEAHISLSKLKRYESENQNDPKWEENELNRIFSVLFPSDSAKIIKFEPREPREPA